MNPTKSAFDELVAHLRRVQTLESAADLLGWDEQVNLPELAAGQRGEQLAALAEVAHGIASAPRAGELIAVLSQAGAELTEEMRAVLAQARRDYERATRLPVHFVREKATQASHGYHAWAAARAAGDFGRYAPVLEKNIDLARREAAYLGRSDAPYDHFLDYNDPGMTASAVSRLFTELKRDLVPLMRSIVAAAGPARPSPLKGLTEDAQKSFISEVTARIGFDYRRGRIDVSLHPFCSGSGDDVRMTTRFKKDEPLDALFSAIHEAGHGLYEQGLPASRWRGTALGMHAGMAVHESQSRLWENQVARSRGFWRFFEPRLRVLFPGGAADVGSEDLYRAINAVAATPIRVESDEVTYNLHIILRFELEQRLFSGDLAVGGLPAAWRELARELLGLDISSDREGVLQDVHWSGGAFGYFPSYCLGNMIASQLWYRALSLRPALEEDFARGDFSWLLQWLRDNVHAQGRRWDALALVRRVTGEELSPQPLVRYLRERYGSLYLG